MSLKAGQGGRETGRRSATRRWVVAASLGAGALLVAAGGISGCSAGGGAGSWSVAGTERAATGDWDDVDAAVRGAAAKNELIIEAADEPDALTRRYQILSARSESGEVVVTRGKPLDPSVRLSREGPVSLRIKARIGMFGDTTRERALIDDIRSRMGELVGAFKTAPLPSGW